MDKDCIKYLLNLVGVEESKHYFILGNETLCTVIYNTFLPNNREDVIYIDRNIETIHMNTNSFVDRDAVCKIIQDLCDIVLRLGINSSYLLNILFFYCKRHYFVGNPAEFLYRLGISNIFNEGFNVNRFAYAYVVVCRHSMVDISEEEFGGALYRYKCNISGVDAYYPYKTENDIDLIYLINVYLDRVEDYVDKDNPIALVMCVLHDSKNISRDKNFINGYLCNGDSYTYSYAVKNFTYLQNFKDYTQEEYEAARNLSKQLGSMSQLYQSLY